MGICLTVRLLGLKPHLHETTLCMCGSKVPCGYVFDQDVEGPSISGLGGVLLNNGMSIYTDYIGGGR